MVLDIVANQIVEQIEAEKNGQERALHAYTTVRRKTVIGARLFGEDG